MKTKHAFCDKEIFITRYDYNHIMIEFEDTYIIIKRDELLTAIGELNLNNLIELNDKFNFIENKEN